ncbi:PAS domain S-box protein [Aquincola sp. S2]|uniref:histidine kinase n=1 Tax=Pseudaquabacterium terrae TaxID=2732868 RepID=A0ABX2EBS2_9BURK|nr:ATP-binding protein [Aquabacterium terrae]NRF66574.1 PAS domain S-box protein [Aquabacterium terrae]
MSVSLDDTGRYRLSPEVSADALERRYQRQLWLGALPLFGLLLVLALWQAWQSRIAVVAELERQATQQHAALQSLARIAADHVADLRLVAERTLVTPPQAPDRALRDALKRRAVDAAIEGYALDELPPLLHGGTAQLLWPQAGAPPPDAALALLQALSRSTEIAHSRHADLAASLFLGWPERQLVTYPWLPSQALLDAAGAPTLAALLDKAYAAPVFAEGRPERDPEQRAYWAPVQRSGDGGPRLLHAAPVYVGEDFSGVVATEIRLASIARVIAARPVGPLKQVYWWVLDARGEVLAERMATDEGPSAQARALPAGLDAAALAEAQRAGGRALPLAGHRIVALDVADAPWTLVVALGDGALLRQALPGLAPFTLIGLALLGLFLRAQVLLRRRVIQPALGVMAYLHAKSLDPNAPEPALPQRWRSWAHVITRTFDEQRDARAAERRSEAFKSAIVDHALAALVATDRLGRIVEFNPAAEAMFGLPRAAAIGRPVAQVVIPQRFRAAHEAAMRRIAEGGPAKLLGKRIEMQALRADGSEFPVEMLLWRADVEGQAYFTASLVDLSERRRQALEIERQRDALRQSEKLSAMGSLLAGVAHELNNPLAIVLGRAGLLEEKCSAQPELAADAQRIREAAERCGRIVRTFLNMARSKPTQRESVAFNELVQAATEMLAYTWRSHGIQLDLHLAERLPAVNADADQIGQIVLNLLVNAQQALSTVTDRPRRVQVTTGVEVPRTGREPRVWLRVADSGPGIAAELAEQIFEPFFTTKADGIGTGLGLAVSRSLAKDHGGNLMLEAVAPLGGACFRLSLPLSGEAGPETAATPLDDAAHANRSRVLVVDDEAEVAELIRDMLESAGHEVAVAESGAVALELLDTARFDAIVSDLRMPDMDGAALWREVVRQHPALGGRMLFITGDTLSAGARDFLDSADCPRLDKPFSKADLVAGVAGLLV